MTFHPNAAALNLTWRKSSRSNDSGNCVEFAMLEETPTFKKSSYSGGNQNCVEYALLPDAVAVRDSKNPSGPALGFGRAAHASFIRAVAVGEFDFGLL
ncbi:MULTISPECIES: DUF397 domain-containing protein [Kitasatospora]|uniref:DUF397 domain-containing protein n=1 Tax=Kitasatospora cathayae TaxID=3004092 RepID=A0ABY7QAX6_9ACTN|nr:DUF397 domain-containing protein [Kitasatospora sp. HUAS 3-15]WBP89584.1 DUF397 domain-containing protein [Kitasatospora sp. HUAS 3-15]